MLLLLLRSSVPSGGLPLGERTGLQVEGNVKFGSVITVTRSKDRLVVRTIVLMKKLYEGSCYYKNKEMM